MVDYFQRPNRPTFDDYIQAEVTTKLRVDMKGMLLDGFVPYNQEDADKYNKLRWWLGITMGDMLDKAADVYPDKEALVDRDNRLTYSQVRENADKLAISLMELGVKPKERVLLQLPNWGEFIYSYFGIQKAGAIVVLLLARHAKQEINHLCRLTSAVAWIVPEKFRSIEYLPIISDVLAANPTLKHVIITRGGPDSQKFLKLEKLIDRADLTDADFQELSKRRPDPMEVAHMGPTGGTTGLPKVAPRTHNSYINKIEYTAWGWEITNHDTFLAVAPAGHSMTFCMGICTTIFRAGKIVMLDSTEPEDILEAIQKEKVTAVVWVPALAQRVVEYEGLKNYDVSSLKKMYCGGQLTPAKLEKDVNKKLGCKYLNAYGGTEGMSTLTRLNYDQSLVHQTVGRPTCPYDIYKIVDENENGLPVNTVGELIVKGPGIFIGYYNTPEENAKIFTKDGFFKTGDLAMIDKHGDIILAGRSKDIIKRGGENISPVEIENLIITHPDVAQVSVVGMPDPVMTERICAYVQLRPGARLIFGGIISFLKAKGASVLQLPERIEFIESMPMTKAGKPDKKPLREDIRNKLLKEGILKE